ncbi:MAG: hypothetical protein WA142_11940 [Rugosibacter sp.]
MSTHSAIESFIVRWTKASGSERANYQLFATELCRPLAVTATPLDITAIAAHFTGKGKWKSALPDILATLEALGRARQVEAGLWVG